MSRAARDGYLEALREATRRDCNSKYYSGIRMVIADVGHPDDDDDDHKYDDPSPRVKVNPGTRTG